MRKILTFIFLFSSVTLFAQSDFKAMQSALRDIIFEHDTWADTLAQELSEKFKKNAEAQMAIARAYMAIKGPNRELLKEHYVEEYMNKALACDPNYAPAYVLKGEYWAYFGQTDSAKVWYEKGMNADPKNPDAYVKYAELDNVNMDDVTRHFNILREARPDLNVDILMAQATVKHGTASDKFTALDDIWNRFGIDGFKANTLFEYAFMLPGENRFDDALKVSLAGYEKWPDRRDVIEVVMNSYAFLNKYDEVLRYADKLHALTDTIISMDCFNIGKAYLGKGEFEKAFEEFAKLNDAQDGLRTMYFTSAQRLVSAMTDELAEKKDYDGAIALYNKYIEIYKPKDMAVAYYNLARHYKSRYIDAPAEDKERMRNELFALYEKTEKGYPNSVYTTYTFFNHAQLIMADVDPTATTGEATPIILGFVDSAEKNGQTEKMIPQICFGYQYIMGYYANKSDMKNVRVYCEKILELDPMNQYALKTMEHLGPETSKGKRKK